MQFKTLFAAAFFGSAVLAAALPQEDTVAEIAGDVPTPEELASLYDETFPGTLETFNAMVAQEKGTGCPFFSNLECLSNCNQNAPSPDSVGANAGCILYCAKSCSSV